MEMALFKIFILLSDLFCCIYLFNKILNAKKDKDILMCTFTSLSCILSAIYILNF